MPVGGSDFTDGLRESLSVNYEQGAAKLDMAEALLPFDAFRLVL